MATIDIEKTVAITGLGCMTGLGLDLGASWQGLIAGQGATKRFTLFDPHGLASPFGVQLPDSAEALFSEHIKKRNRTQMTRGTMIGLLTAHMAAESAGCASSGIDTARIGVVMGGTGTGYAPQSSDIDEHRILRNMASAPAAWVSIKGGYQGPAFMVSTACSSGIYALWNAYWLVRSNRCDAVLAGACDSALSYLDVQGFCSLMALATTDGDIATASRPFDAQRNGFVIAEGGGMLVVESVTSAQKRGAPILALMHEPALTAEAHNILSPEPEGVGMAKTMQLALDNAGVPASAINYINAHGTSTLANDLCETKAIKAVFGGHAYQVPVSSTKSMTGHCLSAAAGVEAVISVKSLVENIIPPTINLTHPDPECDLDYVPHTARKTALNHVMCNSFAFGGHNGVVVFSKNQ